MTEQQEKTVEIYVRPQDSPANVIKDEDFRVFYNGSWVDFRKGKVIITPDPDYNV